MQRSRHQFPNPIVHDGSYGSMCNSYVSLANNSPLPSNNNGMTSNLQNTNWSETLLTTAYAKSLFGYHPQLQPCSSADYNFNVALESPSDNAITDELQPLHSNILTNSHSNLILNIHDSYNVTANGQGCHSSSSLTDLNGDSGFLSSTSLQHFSTVEPCSQNNGFTGSFQHYKFKEVHTFSLII